MIHAPILAVVVIWILSATNLVSMESVLIGDWITNTIIPIAFLLGLFPDLGHVLLTRLAQAIFQDVRGTSASKSTKPTGGERRLPDLVNEEGGAPSVESLRLRLKSHATALFR